MHPLRTILNIVKHRLHVCLAAMVRAHSVARPQQREELSGAESHDGDVVPEQGSGLAPVPRDAGAEELPARPLLRVHPARRAEGDADVSCLLSHG